MTRSDPAIPRAILAACLAVVLIALGVPAARSEGAQRIVSIGGSLTEIIYLLGQESRLAARDATSTYPPETAQLADVGYIRALSPEGVLSVGPDLILSLEGAGPPEAVTLLKQAGVPFVEVPDGASGADILRKIVAVGNALDVAEKAAELAGRVEERLDELEQLSGKTAVKPHVLFILAVQGGRIMVAGSETQADGIIALAGAENAFGAIAGYKQVSDEAILAAAPDAILTMRRGDDFGTGEQQLLAHPAIAGTPAGRAGRIISMDGLYLLGFGPRTADAAIDLHQALYGPEK